MKALKNSIPQVISSKLIADATKKLHKNVMEDIRQMCIQAEVKIASAGKSADVHNQEVMVIEHITYVNIGCGAKRPVKEYLLNDMAAEVLALGYDVKRRIAILKLVKEMKQALEIKRDDVLTWNETGKILNLGVNLLRKELRHFGILGNVKNDYKQYNKPYTKFVIEGCFVGNYPTKTKGLDLIRNVYLTDYELKFNERNNLPNGSMKAIGEGVQTLIDYILCMKRGAMSSGESERFVNKLNNIKFELESINGKKSLE